LVLGRRQVHEIIGARNFVRGLEAPPGARFQRGP
jgi:hypothetical protein